MSILTEWNGLSIPVIDPQVGPGWWRRWLEAGDPLAGIEDMRGCPGEVPLAGHALGGGTPVRREELPGGAAGVPASMIIARQEALRQVGVIVPRYLLVVEGGVNSDKCW